MDSWVFAVLFGIAAVFGLRGSIRMTVRYLYVAEQLDWRERLMLMLLVNICWIITALAGYVGFLTIRNLLGFAPLPELRPITAVLSTLVLFTPTVIDIVVSRVSRVEWPS